MISRLAATLFKVKVDKESKNDAEDSKQIKSMLKKALKTAEPNPMAPYINEPFELFGGNYKLSTIEKEQRIEDTIYRAQEIQIAEHELLIANLKDQNE